MFWNSRASYELKKKRKKGDGAENDQCFQFFFAD